MAEDDLDYGFFGFDETQAAQGDPNVKPILEVPGEVEDRRRSDSITLKWPSLQGQVIHEVKLQAMPAFPGFEGGFDTTPSGGGKSTTVKDPLDNNFGSVDGLKPSTEYVFRMVAKNEAGTTLGPATAPIKTLEYAPERGDKSAWLTVLPDRKKMSGVKSLGRRFSFKKLKPLRYFFVLEGALLTWYKEVDGEEVDYVHLGKLREISFPQRTDNTAFTLVLGNDRLLEIECTSDKPGISDKDVFQDWVETLTRVRREVGGSATQVVHKTVRQPK
ncbi:hypothetical protein PTSG_09576 [Salpingoeca rosetta]|uniref:Fibronectin type-III domain-containing protein n=1 Tax=Salpingoeca rosetta (strain ATCC 50818 / BSB-021) TaxID=946362 RepID=F2ULE2_SALR5|nr:uncharacterized protein PTSG_09576 [Salpingoeca rosetta]EGD77941.1 hypothetical protein PTSG_09576 [Salpingoeca rosetta]|eukprot:XP_004990004.1 hypothetical protein PTSG_09576 [Salpingoeca rosetta]